MSLCALIAIPVQFQLDIPPMADGEDVFKYHVGVCPAISRRPMAVDAGTHLLHVPRNRALEELLIPQR